jgi:hypothetical protein
MPTTRVGLRAWRLPAAAACLFVCLTSHHQRYSQFALGLGLAVFDQTHPTSTPPHPTHRRAALEYLRVSGRTPAVLHCHEWQAAAVPMLYWERLCHELPGARCVFTIHNFDSTGECRQDEFAYTGEWGGRGGGGVVFMR